MLAFFAGQGRLPVLLAHRLADDGVAFQVFEMRGHSFENPDDLPVQSFRIEHLGSIIDQIVADGFKIVCFAGAVRRPKVDMAQVDAATAPILSRINAAIAAGDDGALRTIMQLFTERGLDIRSAQDIAPELLQNAGVITDAKPDAQHLADTQLGWSVLAGQGLIDGGQACIIARGAVLAEETVDGTDAMLAQVTGAAGGLLFKGPKPGQDRRAEMPTIGLQTVAGAAQAGLDGIVVAANGVLLLDLPDLITACNAAGLFLLIAEPP